MSRRSASAVTVTAMLALIAPLAVGCGASTTTARRAPVALATSKPFDATGMTEEAALLAAQHNELIASNTGSRQ